MGDKVAERSDYGNADTRIKMDLLGVAIFLCGATASINLNLIGEVYASELLLIPVALGILIFRGDGGVISSRSFQMFLVVGVVTLSGYMITDLVIGTEPSQYLRGWGRVGLLISNVLCLMLVIGQGRRYLWWFVLGMGVGGVAYLAMSGLPLGIWKLGYGERVSLIVLALSCVLPRPMALLLLAAFGLLNIALDYRNFAATYLIIAGIFWVRSGKARSDISGFKSYFLLGAAATLSVVVLAVGLSMTEDEYGGRRADSNVGRWSGIIVSVRAIADSPIIGYGSWTVNEEYARMLQEEQAKRFDRTRARRAPSYGAKMFRSHSQILQPWVEAGILGAAFFLFYAYRLVDGAKRYILSKPVDRFTAMNLYFVILGTWHLIASPFGGDQRIFIAVVVATLAAIEFDSRRKKRREVIPVTHGPENPSLVSQTGDRILRRRRTL